MNICDACQCGRIAELITLAAMDYFLLCCVSVALFNLCMLCCNTNSLFKTLNFAVQLKTRIRPPPQFEPQLEPKTAVSSTFCVMCFVLCLHYSPAISKRFEKRMMDFVVLLRSDQTPNSGPVSSPLRLKADRPRPRKYGGASRICKYLHIVGKMTAEQRSEKRVDEQGGKGGRSVTDKACLTTAKQISIKPEAVSSVMCAQTKCQEDSALMRPLSHVFKYIKLSLGTYRTQCRSAQIWVQ